VLFANIRHAHASKRAFEPLFLGLCKSSGMQVEAEVGVILEPDKELKRAVQMREANADENR
jgi:hypothetical protein